MLAAGIPDLFDDGQSGLVVAGYAVMRFAMVAHVAPRRGAATRSGGGPPLCVCGGHRRRAGALDRPAGGRGPRVALLVSFCARLVLELLVPVVAERGRRITPFHPHHIAERYALLTIIVLGEVILASVQAVQGALESGVTGRPARPSSSAGCSSSSRCGGSTSSATTPNCSRDRSGTTFWPATDTSPSSPVCGDGCRARSAVDLAGHEAHAASRLVGLALAGAVAVYLTTLGVFHAVADGRAGSALSTLVTAGSVVVAALLGPSIGVTALLIGLVLAAAVAQHVWSTSTRDDVVASPG